jgi:hypothetical protein
MPQPQSVPASTPQSSPAEFSPEELKKHRGHWLAFSPDGARLIASCLALKELDAKVRAAGENPEDVLLDWIPGGDAIVSGAELS